MVSRLLRAAFAVAAIWVVSAVIAPAVALAAHVRHADIAWRIPNPATAPNTVEFVVNFTWRTNNSSENLQMGDGNSYRVGNGAANTTLVASGTDASGSVFNTYRTVVTHTYSSTGRFTAEIDGNARISNLNNGGDSRYRMAVDVDLRAGNSAAPNTAGPQTASNALISLQAGTQVEYLFPMTDPDGDPVTCRIQTQAESSIPGPSFGGTTPVIDTFNGACRIRWDLRNASTNTTLHSLPIRMESIHGGLVSSSVIDVIALTSNIAPPVCTGSAALTVGVGQTATATVTGTHGSNGSGNMRMDAIGAPPGAIISPRSGSSAAAPFDATVTWTPGAADSGTTRLVLMTYTNSANSSASCTVSIFTRPECGNGVIETGESCDDGNTSNEDDCTSECRFRPTAEDDDFTSPEDTVVIFDPRQNDPTFIEGRNVMVMIHHETHHGTMVLLPDGRVEYTPELNFHGRDDFGYMLFDGVAMSTHTTANIHVTPVNDPPVAVPGEFTTPEEEVIEFRIFATDVDGGAVGFDMLSTTTNGVLSGSPPVLTYTPNDNFNGVDSFTFRANDTLLTSPPATITIDVTPVNDAPLADAQSTTLAEDTSRGITLSGSDIDSDGLDFSVLTGPANGRLSGSGADLTYTPEPNFNGEDSFTFQTNDGGLASQPATVSVTVTPVNDRPVASDGSTSTDEDEDVALTLQASDIDQDVLGFAIAEGPANGMLTGTAPNLIYTPFPNFQGSDSFTFTASDGDLGSEAATYVLTVRPVNDAPLAVAQAATLDEDTTRALTLAGSDVDNDELTFVVVNGPANGALSGNGQNLTYTPAANFNGQDSFTFRTNDGQANSEPVTVTLDINPVNDAPLAESDEAQTDEDESVDLLLAATDIDSGELAFTIEDEPTNGSLSGSAPDVVYTPNDNFNGTDSFTFSVSDGDLGSNLATIDIVVSPRNDAPTADSQDLTVDEDTSLDVALTGADIDEDELIFELLDAPDSGEITGSGSDLTYMPDPNFNGEDSFTFRTRDGALFSPPATVTVTVTPVNDAPVALSDDVQTAEDESIDLLLAATDIDSGELAFTIEDEPTNGSLSGSAPDVVYTPNGNFNGTDSFTFSVSDGALGSNLATIDIVVSPRNDSPTADDQAVSVEEDSSVEVLLTGADIDVDELIFELLDAPADGELTGTAPDITYTPGPDFNGEDSFTFRTGDGELFSSPATVVVTVTPVNDMPVAVSDAVQTAEDESLEVTLTGGDIDSEELIFSVTDEPISGELTGTAPDLMYVPNADFNGEDTFTFTINDGEVDAETATITITVTPVNDAPTIADVDSIALADPDSADVTLELADIDNDADDLTVEITSSDDSIIDPSSVILTTEGGERTLTVLSNGAVGTATVTATVTDPDGLSDSTTFDVTVTCVDDLDDDDLCDASDPDLDGDGADNGDDNCPDLANSDQDDLDNDNIGDACDDDIDGDGLTNTDETERETDPLVVDTDGDGCGDGQEVNDGSDPLNGVDCDAGLLVDTDEDGLTDFEEETLYNTNPEVADTDNDGLTDGEEVLDYETDPLDDDSDTDGLLDGEEVFDYETDPLDADTDEDGCIDGGEINDGTDPLNPIDCDQGLLIDTDEDGLTDYEEITVYETDPDDADSDDDGLTDGDEVLTYETDPLDSDTDDDACTDGDEIDGGTDPLYPIDCGDGLLVDTDDDGVPDYEEIVDHETDPTNDDTDGDGIPDGEELDQGTDPLDPEDGVLTYIAGGCDCQTAPLAPTGAAVLLPLLLLWTGRRRTQAA